MFLQIFFSFSVLFLSTYAYYRYAIKTNILDTPSERSSHTVPTVRGGGVVFFIAILFYFVITAKIAYPYFFGGFLILSIIGFIDDKRNLSPKTRFPFQLLAIGLILYEAGLFAQDIPVLWQIVGFIIAVGFVNAFNFMDGINGITGFYTTAIVLPLWYINHNYSIINNEMYIVILIAIIVFGFFNFRKKALMFAGDIGSMSLAAVILFWITKTIIELRSPVILVFVVIYGVDSALTIMVRIKKKEKVFEAHRHHLYQKFVDIWHWHHLKVATLYAGIQLLISFMTISFIQETVSTQLIITFIIYLLLSIIYFLAQKYFKTQI